MKNIYKFVLIGSIVLAIGIYGLFFNRLSETEMVRWSYLWFPGLLFGAVGLKASQTSSTALHCGSHRHGRRFFFSSSLFFHRFEAVIAANQKMTKFIPDLYHSRPALESRMETLSHLFESNKAWAGRIRQQDPEFFPKLSRQQSPSYLWIGCSDSRVPANEIVGLLPGELFVHRNIANLVVHTDLNCLSVMQFAVDILKVRHIIVCGHYGCSGVQAALRRDRLGLSDNWLRHIQDVREKHTAESATGAIPRLATGFAS